MLRRVLMSNGQALAHALSSAVLLYTTTGLHSFCTAVQGGGGVMWSSTGNTAPLFKYTGTQIAGLGKQAVAASKHKI